MLAHQLGSNTRGAGWGRPHAETHLVSCDSWTAPTGRAQKIRLDLSENRFVARRRLENLVRSVSPECLNMYPEYDELLSALGEYTLRRGEEILLCNGADQAIELILRAFCPGRRLVLPVPTFSYYQHVAAVCGILLAKVPFDREFRLDIERVEGALRQGADGVVLVSPSNPLSCPLAADAILSVLRSAAERGAFVVLDEVYAEFDGLTQVELLDEFPNLFIIRSFSKGFGLAGMRLGYVLTCPRNIDILAKLRGPWDVNALSVEMALAALRADDWFDFLPALRQARSELARRLEAIGFSVFDSQANFVLAKSENAARVAAWLAERDVLIADMSHYPDASGILDDCLRIGVPGPAEQAHVFDLLDACAAELAKSS